MRLPVTPGMRSSEFVVALVTVLLNILNNSQDWTSTRSALIASLPALAYVLSRGLAKYEQRPPTSQPPPA